MPKLIRQRARECAADYAAGVSIQGLCEKYNITRASVNRIARRCGKPRRNPMRGTNLDYAKLARDVEKVHQYMRLRKGV